MIFYLFLDFYILYNYYNYYKAQKFSQYHILNLFLILLNSKNHMNNPLVFQDYCLYKFNKIPKKISFFKQHNNYEYALCF